MANLSERNALLLLEVFRCLVPKGKIFTIDFPTCKKDVRV